jgi:hypothetical protein
MLGGGSLMDAMSCFEKKFKDKSGLKWADRAGEPKANKCKWQHIWRKASEKSGS